MFGFRRQRKHNDGALCHRCGRGHLISNDAEQHCDYCGRIFWQEPATVWFRDIAIGEHFYSAYRPDELLVKLNDCHPRDGNNYELVDQPGRGGNCGYAAPCIREHDKTMKGSGFTYN